MEKSGQTVSELHWHAEEVCHASKAKCPPQTEHETQRLLHAFAVQKIELELQNQELRNNVTQLEKVMLSHQKLEQKIAKRTVCLEMALREQEAFSYSVSHDLRAPLRHINCYLAILSEDFGTFLPAEAHSLIARSRSASQRMGKLIDDLLELSRISRIKLNKSSVNLSDLARSVSAALCEAEPQRKVAFKISNGLCARGNKSLLMQLMVNLLGNAWKYSAANPSPCIEFGKEIQEDQDVFYVKDNGVGFDMAYSDKLFCAFHRLHGSEFEGTGIGLATVKSIVDRHRGRVWAHSVINEGATFYFTL